jgi:hypothetical protein
MKKDYRSAIRVTGLFYIKGMDIAYRKVLAMIGFNFWIESTHKISYCGQFFCLKLDLVILVLKCKELKAWSKRNKLYLQDFF